MTTAEMNEELKSGELFLSPGEYDLDGTLYVPRGSGIIGDGEVVLRVGGNFPAIVVDGGGVALVGFSVVVYHGPYSNHAILARHSSGLEVESVEVRSEASASNAGICVYRCSDVRIAGCSAEGFRFGIFLTTSVSKALVRDCYVSGCPTGIYVYGAEGTCDWIEITGCRVRNERGAGENGTDGILMDRCTSVFVHENFLSTNMEHGLYLSGVHLGVVRDNFCVDNTVNGIQMVSSSEVVVEGNTCSYNGGNGIYLDRCSRNVVKDNSCVFNEKWGILEVSGDGTDVIVGNYTFSNSLGNVHRG